MDNTTDWIFTDVPGETIMIANNPEDPARIDSTDYWQSERARRGIIGCSLHAQTFRVLVPKAAADTCGGEAHMIDEMNTGQLFMVLQGPNQNGQPSYRIVFDDGTHTPYFFEISEHQMLISQQPAKGKCRLIVYIDGRQTLDTPAEYRTVKMMVY